MSPSFIGARGWRCWSHLLSRSFHLSLLQVANSASVVVCRLRHAWDRGRMPIPRPMRAERHQGPNFQLRPCRWSRVELVEIKRICSHHAVQWTPFSVAWSLTVSRLSCVRPCAPRWSLADTKSCSMSHLHRSNHRMRELLPRCVSEAHQCPCRIRQTSLHALRSRICP